MAAVRRLPRGVMAVRRLSGVSLTPWRIEAAQVDGEVLAAGIGQGHAVGRDQLDLAAAVADEVDGRGAVVTWPARS